MWRSLVAHLTGGQGVAGSNPVIPTIFYRGIWQVPLPRGACFCVWFLSEIGATSAGLHG